MLSVVRPISIDFGYPILRLSVYSNPVRNISIVSKKNTFLENLKQKKSQFLLHYGSSFLLTHEMLGISSYVITYSLISFHIIDLPSIVSFLGWTTEDLTKYNIDLNSKVITFAMTVAIVKCLDVMGLIPLRWGLTLILTPFVAKWIGPYLDRIVSLFKRR